MPLTWLQNLPESAEGKIEWLGLRLRRCHRRSRRWRRLRKELDEALRKFKATKSSKLRDVPLLVQASTNHQQKLVPTVSTSSSQFEQPYPRNRHVRTGAGKKPGSHRSP